MFSGFVAAVIVFFHACFAGCVVSERFPTCEKLELSIKSKEAEIESLKLAIQEYKLANGDEQDVTDECSRAPTCSKCVREQRNIGCGWCILRNRCSLQTNCSAKHSGADSWIYSGDRCPKIRAVKPHVLAADTVRTLQISIPYLPKYEGAFICSFEVLGKSLITKGKIEDRGITCPSPDTSNIPSIPFDTDHVPVKLSVRTPNGPNFASTYNFTIYDCRRINSCTECASSSFPCAWCTSGNRCTHDVSEYCRNDIIVFSKSVSFPTSRQGPAYCSKILPYVSESNNILIHSGLKKRIQVKTENLVLLQVSSRLTCKVKGFPEVTAQLLGDVIYCSEMKVKVLDGQAISKLPLSVFWGGRGNLANPENLHVVVYHCGLMASNCGECLSLPAEYNCGWCEDTDSCAIRDNCQDAVWMDSRQTCLKPVITSFHPKAGLLSQQTNITIRGINLGKELRDIEGVRLINEESEVISECIPHESLFARYSQIVCLLDIPEIPLDNNGTLRGFFEIRLLNDEVTISEEEFHFVDPSITEFKPVKGMESGGTLLQINGQNLNSGNNVEAFIGDVPCNILSRDSLVIKCITSPASRTSRGSLKSSSVRVVFDGEERVSSNYFFYVADSEIHSVRSEYDSNDPVGTLSGGSLIIVKGVNFDTVPNPYIYVVVDKVEYPGACTVLSDKHMECLSPRIPTEVLNFCGGEGGYMTLDYGFKMGDVEELRNISLKEDFGKFRLYPDPHFKPFAEDGMVKTYNSGPLTIYGRQLDTMFNENDITVLVGTEECTLTSLSHTQLNCIPPETQPDEEERNINKLPEVIVRIRSTHEYFIGFLRYG